MGKGESYPGKPNFAVCKRLLLHVFLKQKIRHGITTNKCWLFMKAPMCSTQQQNPGKELGLGACNLLRFTTDFTNESKSLVISNHGGCSQKIDTTVHLDAQLKPIKCEHTHGRCMVLK